MEGLNPSKWFLTPETAQTTVYTNSVSMCPEEKIQWSDPNILNLHFLHCTVVQYSTVAQYFPISYICIIVQSLKFLQSSLRRGFQTFIMHQLGVAIKLLKNQTDYTTACTVWGHTKHHTVYCNVFLVILHVKWL